MNRKECYESSFEFQSGLRWLNLSDSCCFESSFRRGNKKGTFSTTNGGNELFQDFHHETNKKDYHSSDNV